MSRGGRRDGAGAARRAGMASGVLPWTPARLSGIAAWLRADRGITLNGSTVSQWADQAGGDDNATQGTANQQPAYSGSGTSAKLTFDGVNDNMTIADSARTSLTTAYTLFGSVKQATAIQRDWFAHGDSNASLEWLLRTDGASFVAYAGSTANFALSSGGFAAGSIHHFVVIYDGSLTGNANRLKVYLDGVLITPSYGGTIPASLPDPTAAVEIGMAMGTAFWNGDIYELGIVSRAVSSAEARKLYSYWRPT